MSITALAVALIQVLGHHRPVWFDTDISTENHILAAKMIEGEAIWLYLDRPGEPLALVLPWSRDAAQGLQDAMRESNRRGRDGALMKFDPSLDDNEPQFHPLPQEAVPPPKGSPPPALNYNRR